jgi:hypothetical protein
METHRECICYVCIEEATVALLVGHYATRCKVAGSNSEEIIEFLNWPDASSRTSALGVNSTSNRNEYKKSSWG